MMTIEPDRVDVTRILNAFGRGDEPAARDLLPLVYEELRRLAAWRLAQEGPGQTLQPTALVHEAYLRVVGPDTGKPWDGRGHFFAAAAEAMRRIVLDRARDRKRLKRGGSRRRASLDLDGLLADDAPPDDLIDLDEALARLAEVDAGAAELVKLRLFAGLTLGEAAFVLGIGRRTPTATGPSLEPGSSTDSGLGRPRRVLSGAGGREIRRLLAHPGGGRSIMW